MDDVLRFLGVMAALSASAQTMTQQLRKRLNWLNTKRTDEDSGNELIRVAEGKLHANVHLVCGVNGFILAALGNIHPLSYLGLQPIWAQSNLPLLTNLIDYLCAGVLVAYGGPWFHEVLGIVREYKKSLRGTP
ncbi:hypothetical protein CIG75_14135 [Tumebacillus algifaecis]|uniref:Uncharacterized protein n=1 Tax=Tumebacillus algifaecis TaxID=1214604 RepID=A0A223D2U4_9BACL|nr:hypothetical protein [Tumebacillus algifaecis]ASS75988.1 hypothetical protein CIG75_14135 [Tumebacillus algifaecis]